MFVLLQMVCGATTGSEPLAVETRTALSERVDLPLDDDPLSVIGSLPEIRGIMPPIEELPPNRWLCVAGWMAVIAVVAVLILLQRRRYIARFAYICALRALRGLRHDDLTDDEDIKRFYLRLNQVLRKYIQRCYGINIVPRSHCWFRVSTVRGVCRLSRTNMELLADLDVRPNGDEARQMIQNLLRTCDLVKFAEYRPTPAKALAALAAGIRFVKETAALREGVGEE
jgi:hypothetical protein